MDTSAISDIVARYRSALLTEITVDEMIVFGSHLEGTANEDSDLDVIVVSDDFETLTEDERLDILE